MNLAVLGGDARSVYMARRLAEAGHRVRCHNLAPLPAYTPEDALGRADAVILPIPTKDFPLTDHILSHIPPQARIFAGAVSKELRFTLESRGFAVTDVLALEALAVENAALTARAAAGLLQSALPRSIAGEEVLIVGAGRIGKLLGLQLQQLGARVTAAARSPEGRAWCRALGLQAASLDAMPGCAIVVNTVPARVIDSNWLARLPEGSLLMELASAPGGFDPMAAKAMGHTLLPGGGLPGKYLPESAGYAIAHTILELLK